MNELMSSDSVRVIEFANNGGYVIGICNGFQVLTESGLLPGTLLKNESLNFEYKINTLLWALSQGEKPDEFESDKFSSICSSDVPNYLNVLVRLGLVSRKPLLLFRIG